MINHKSLSLALASAGFFIACVPASAQWQIPDNAVPIGRGAGVTGFKNVPLPSGSLLIGQSGIPLAIIPTGDVTITTGGVTAIGATKVTSAMLNSNVYSTAHTWSGQQTFVAPILGTPASGVATNLTGTAAGLTAGNVTTNANLTGDVTSVGNVTTLTNAPVIAKVLTGFVSGTGTVTAADSILTAMQKLYGNDALKAPLASPTFTGIPAAPTASPSNNSTQIATTAYVDAQVAGGVSGVASLNGKTGALVSYYPPQGRLTLTSATPVMSTSVAGATTAYYTPYAGNMVPIYDGTNLVPTAFAEVSQATTDTTKSPAAVAASKVYDIFCWVDTGPTNRCTRGPAWTNDTTRGYTLTYVNGIALNTSAITNGPAASRGTWVATVRSDASSTFNYVFGSSASGGVAGNFGVWNAYNRVTVVSTVSDTGVAYTYTGATRQARASAGNQVSFIMGGAEDGIQASYGAGMSTVSVAGALGIWGPQINSTSTIGCRSSLTIAITANVTTSANTAFCTFQPVLGYNYVSANESSDGTNANSFNAGTSNALTVTLRM